MTGKMHPQKLAEMAGTMPVYKLAEFFGATENHVRVMASKNGISLAWKNKRWPTSDDRKLKTLRASGVPVKEIAVILDRTYDSVLARIKKKVAEDDWPVSVQGMRRAQATHPREFLTGWRFSRNGKQPAFVDPDARVMVDFGGHRRRICKASEINWPSVRKFRVIKTDYY